MRAGQRRASSWGTAFFLFFLALAPPGGEARAAASAPEVDPGGMVASAHVEATRAGAAMLAAGGNAVDAAVATSFALSVAEPYHSGIGGGGFLLIRLANGRVLALDGREEAPAAATRDMFVAPGVPEDASRLGGLAVGVPGLVAALVEALERHGTMSLPEVMAPAITLAEQGVQISPRHAAKLSYWKSKNLHLRFPETARIQLPPEGQEIQEGWLLRQPDLARTLRRIAEEGPRAFYEGPIAEAMVSEIERQGGILSKQDLATYAPKWREPVAGIYRGHEVFSFPPPSSGGVALIEILNILEGFDLAAQGAGSSASLHLIGEAMKLAFADRAAHLGDADFVSVPVAGLTAKSYADTLRERINPSWYKRAPWTWGRREQAISLKAAGVPPTDGGTTHLSVADSKGNAVALTQTINLLFGASVTVPGTGIVLNNEMDDFAKAPNSPNAFGLVDTTGANAIAAGKRPLSSMTPTIVLRDGKLFLVAGSPGGPRIITTTLLALLNVVDYGMDVQQAAAAPRFHHQWVPDEMVLEPDIPRDVSLGLERRGHQVKVSTRFWSSAQLIRYDAERGLFLGASDPRSDGAAKGPGSLK